MGVTGDTEVDAVAADVLQANMPAADAAIVADRSRHGLAELAGRPEILTALRDDRGELGGGVGRRRHRNPSALSLLPPSGEEEQRPGATVSAGGVAESLVWSSDYLRPQILQTAKAGYMADWRNGGTIDHFPARVGGRHRPPPEPHARAVQAANSAVLVRRRVSARARGWVLPW